MGTFFSASQLVKCSAKQLWYLRKHPEAKKKVTPLQLKGSEYAENNSISPFIEMSGRFTHKEIDIYYSVDEVRLIKGGVAYAIEHKMVDFKDDAFEIRSIIQTAFYGALMYYGDGLLRTATYQPGKKYNIKLPARVYHYLNFGGKYIKISCDAEQVMRFFLTKARASMKFSTAKRFDDRYNKREHSYFKDFIDIKYQGPRSIHLIRKGCQLEN